MKLPEPKEKTMVICHGFLLLLSLWPDHQQHHGRPWHVLQLTMQLKLSMRKLEILIYSGLGIESEVITCRWRIWDVSNWQIENLCR